MTAGIISLANKRLARRLARDKPGAEHCAQRIEELAAAAASLVRQSVCADDTHAANCITSAVENLVGAIEEVHHHLDEAFDPPATPAPTDTHTDDGDAA